MQASNRAVLRVYCPDRPGLVAEVAGLLFKLGVNILHADEHIDQEANTFFQRLDFLVPDTAPRESFRAQIGEACERWGMRWVLRFRDEKRRVAVLTSKRGHCTLDLLMRHRSGEMNCDIPFVLSNHPDLGNEVTRAGYEFVHEPMGATGQVKATPEQKAAQEARILAKLASERIDLVVLARYMQILSPAFTAAWSEKVINIHHSFLPAFAGADPYRQAFRRGVKLVGATSHYATADLDEGPIIAQAVEPVSHRDTVEDLERKGRDLERVVLARAVRNHLEDRIVAYGNKTVVFD